MYKFSAPMPYEIENIDKLLDINNGIEKSQITSLFFSLPSNCELFTGFEQYRNNYLNKNWDYWKKLITYALNKAEFIYLLNSPNRMPIESQNFEEKLQKLDYLLSELYLMGVNKLRIAEHKLMSYISKQYPQFKIYASTSFEFQNLAQYQNFMFMHPEVKQIVPSHDSIKNFTFLKNLKKLLPNTEIEIMVNEGCIQGCPNRDGHASEIMDREINNRNDINISNGYYTNKFCAHFEQIYPFLTLAKSNKIFPWEIEEYSRIGIKNFKLVGRDAFIFNIKGYLEEYYKYLKGIDDYKNIEHISINELIHHMKNNDMFDILEVKDVRHLLPDIKYFRKYGELCASRCGVECRYCYKCAEKIQKVFKKKQKEMRKSIMPFCVMSK